MELDKQASLKSPPSKRISAPAYVRQVATIDVSEIPTSVKLAVMIEQEAIATAVLKALLQTFVAVGPENNDFDLIDLTLGCQ